MYVKLLCGHFCMLGMLSRTQSYISHINERIAKFACKKCDDESTECGQIPICDSALKDRALPENIGDTFGFRSDVESEKCIRRAVCLYTKQIIVGQRNAQNAWIYKLTIRELVPWANGWHSWTALFAYLSAIENAGIVCGAHGADDAQRHFTRYPQDRRSHMCWSCWVHWVLVFVWRKALCVAGWLTEQPRQMPSGVLPPLDPPGETMFVVMDCRFAANIWPGYFNGVVYGVHCYSWYIIGFLYTWCCCKLRRLTM